MPVEFNHWPPFAYGALGIYSTSVARRPMMGAGTREATIILRVVVRARRAAGGKVLFVLFAESEGKRKGKGKGRGQGGRPFSDLGWGGGGGGG
jgi:hypothetical protein